jgi:DNA-binding GntR family transcriptional regulator
MQVPQTRLQDYVYDQLSALILNGDIAPGQTITVQTLSQAFGVSATPVREALQKLVAEKALETIAGRSIGIPPLRREQLVDLTRVRVLVEGAAAEWATPNVTKDVIRELEAHTGEMVVAAKRRDVKAYLKSNTDFHFKIYRLCGSELTYSMIQGLWLKSVPHFHDMYELDQYTKANDHHRSVMQALKARDGVKVREGICADILTGSELLLSNLPKAGANPERPRARQSAKAA